MNGFERIHECVGQFTDAGQWQLTNEPIVRCKNCKWACESDDDGGYDVHFLACTWWMGVSRSSGDLFVEEDDFCSHGEKMDDAQ
ncbi:MAG: hypothetical protein PUE29_10335 [Olsenella sp.]|nr:hypothetical protein [Olsenella sp.]